MQAISPELTKDQGGSTFPKFADGDLVIKIPGYQVYQLHSGVVRRASKFLANFLTEDQGAKLTTKAKIEGAVIRYRLDLVGVDTGAARFERVTVDEQGHSFRTNILFENQYREVPNTAYFHYDNLFRSFYNEPLNIDDSNLTVALQSCIGLVSIAEKYDCVNAVRDSIEIALLRQGQVLFKSIAQNPVAWGNFSLRLRSPTIFKDSLIHLVGKWKMLSEDEHMQLHPTIVAVCEKKFKEFQLIKEATELRMLGHYTPRVIKKEVESPGRTHYANDVYSWMSIALFRHWFAQNICQGSNMHAIDGGFAFYYMLSRGGQAYLDRAQCEGFHLYCPMTSKGKTVFENHLSDYKAEIQKFVAPLMLNRTQLEPKEHLALTHLVSLEVDAQDYPWNNANTGSVAL